jgi:hypothetical protein
MPSEDRDVEVNAVLKIRWPELPRSLLNVSPQHRRGEHIELHDFTCNHSGTIEGLVSTKYTSYHEDT